MKYLLHFEPVALVGFVGGVFGFDNETLESLSDTLFHEGLKFGLGRDVVRLAEFHSVWDDL